MGSSTTPTTTSRRTTNVDEIILTRSELFTCGIDRVQAALDYRELFSLTWAKFESSSPYRISLSPGSSNRVFDVVAALSEEPPRQLGLIFSNWLHNLRASLDNGIYDLARSLSGQSPPPDEGALQYPIAETRKSFKGMQATKALGRLSPTIYEHLQDIQPYNNRGGIERSTLYWLNELAKIDRHRVMHLAVGRLDHKGIQLTADTPFEVATRYAPPEISLQGTPIMKIRLLAAPKSGSLRVESTGLKMHPGIPGWKGLYRGWHESRDGRVFFRDGDGLLENMRRIEKVALSRLGDLIELSSVVHPGIDQLWSRIEKEQVTSEVSFVDATRARTDGMHLTQRLRNPNILASRSLKAA